MQPFDVNQAWGEKNITPLEHPISEFNARGGMELAEYLALQDHLTAEHPDMGQEQWGEIQKTLPPVELLEDPNTKQRLRVQRFNWPGEGADIGDQTVTTYTLPFSVPIDLDHLIYQHHLLAEALGTPFMVIENPGYGESDKLTSIQKSALKEDGDFKPVAQAMLGIIQSFGIKRLNCIGYSMGAETATAIAALASRYSIEVENLFVMESPRVIEQNPVKLGVNFGADAKNLKFAWKHPVDPVLRKTAKLEIGLPKGLLSYGRALYRGGLQGDLETALKTQPNMKLINASAGSSKVSPSGANAQIHKQLKANFPDRSIRQIIVPGESHAYGDSGRRYAHLAKLVLR